MYKPLFLRTILTKTARSFFRRIHRITHRQPISPREITTAKVLLIAPHSDDEVISSGGTLALHQQAKSTVRVVCVTSSPSAPKDSEAAKRDVEAQEVASMLGFELVFLEHADGSVSTTEERLASQLQSQLQEFQPDILMCPFPMDSHRDHQATTAATSLAVTRSGFDKEIWCYEVWSALWPNTAVNIESVMDTKRSAINTYASQTHTMPYADAALGLNSYRGIQIYGRCAEAFYVCSAEEFGSMGKALQSI